MRQMHKRVFDDVRNAASNAETIGCTGEFADFVRKTAPDDETVRCIGGFADFVRETAFDDEAVRCIDGFAMMPEKLHPTLKRLDALANFFFFSLATKLRAASC